MGDHNANNRVTTREFYDALLKTNDKMDRMERRILDKIEQFPERCPLVNQVQTNKEEIDLLRKRSNILDTITGLVALVATGLGLRP